VPRGCRLRGRIGQRVGDHDPSAPQSVQPSKGCAALCAPDSGRGPQPSPPRPSLNVAIRVISPWITVPNSPSNSVRAHSLDGVAVQSLEEPDPRASRGGTTTPHVPRQPQKASHGPCCKTRRVPHADGRHAVYRGHEPRQHSCHGSCLRGSHAQPWSAMQTAVSRAITPTSLHLRSGAGSCRVPSPGWHCGCGAASFQPPAPPPSPAAPTKTTPAELSWSLLHARRSRALVASRPRRVSREAASVESSEARPFRFFCHPLLQSMLLPRRSATEAGRHEVPSAERCGLRPRPHRR